MERYAKFTDLKLKKEFWDLKNTPLTDALIDRHIEENRGTVATHASALRQVKEFIAHARKLETDRARLIQALAEMMGATEHRGDFATDCPLCEKVSNARKLLEELK